MELISKWITGVTAASIIVAAAVAVTPKGAMKKSVRFVGGLILFLAMTAPLKELDPSDLAFYNMQYRADYERYEEKLITENAAMIKTIIEDKTRTYILQKADELGIRCDVEVFAKKRDDGYPYPDHIIITAEADLESAKKEKLTYLLASELGVIVENQEWRSMEDEQ